MEYIKEQGRHCIINIPDDKEVESITFTNGEHVLFLDLPEDLVEKLNTLVKENNTTIDAYICSALEENIRRNEKLVSIEQEEGLPETVYFLCHKIVICATGKTKYTPCQGEGCVYCMPNGCASSSPKYRVVKTVDIYPEITKDNYAEMIDFFQKASLYFLNTTKEMEVPDYGPGDTYETH